MPAGSSVDARARSRSVAASVNPPANSRASASADQAAVGRVAEQTPERRGPGVQIPGQQETAVPDFADERDFGMTRPANDAVCRRGARERAGFVEPDAFESREETVGDLRHGAPPFVDPMRLGELRALADEPDAEDDQHHARLRCPSAGPPAPRRSPPGENRRESEQMDRTAGASVAVQAQPARSGLRRHHERRARLQGARLQTG